MKASFLCNIIFKQKLNNPDNISATININKETILLACVASVPVWFLIIPLVFFYLDKQLFLGFFQFEGNFVHHKIDLKYLKKSRALWKKNNR